MKSIIDRFTRECTYHNLEIGDSITMLGWSSTYTVTAIHDESQNSVRLSVKSNSTNYSSDHYQMDKRIGIQVIKK